MDATSWNRVRYTFWAPVYDLIAGRVVKGRRRSLELLEPKPGERLLLVGCGTGLDLELLPRGIAITAVDITPAMVERTRARAAQLGLDVDAQVMDASNLEFADQSFDCVVLHLILAVVPDPYATAREAARVIRAGGRVAIFDKFLPDVGSPSIARRAANVLIRLAATDINRRLALILEGTPLRITHAEPSIFGGMFRVVLGVRG